MTRNLSQRIEGVAPVAARAGRERLWEILDLALRDQRHAWIMDSKGHTTQLQPSGPDDGPERRGMQSTLMELTLRRATPGERERSVAPARTDSRRA
jgi:polyphosphate kinase